ncbi:hypothetical protein KGF56_003634 [Candida oxycetoniae]|uniref:Uncharacterized protein n=1 Tax=Candida oxycetoniae TaxID=497107 RepID=A0AAI9SVG7_9ASCO|nr:uncharacterized protein KGF56_003634 [Candida oxycetoniae]KAI3403589.2 hypothetical protein KGF56_003634 [Candida oxycetoniae]
MDQFIVGYKQKYYCPDNNPRVIRKRSSNGQLMSLRTSPRVIDNAEIIMKCNEENEEEKEKEKEEREQDKQMPALLVKNNNNIAKKADIFSSFDGCYETHSFMANTSRRMFSDSQLRKKSFFPTLELNLNMGELMQEEMEEEMEERAVVVAAMNKKEKVEEKEDQHSVDKIHEQTQNVMSGWSGDEQTQNVMPGWGGDEQTQNVMSGWSGDNNNDYVQSPQSCYYYSELVQPQEVKSRIGSRLYRFVKASLNRVSSTRSSVESETTPSAPVTTLPTSHLQLSPIDPTGNNSIDEIISHPSVHIKSQPEVWKMVFNDASLSAARASTRCSSLNIHGNHYERNSNYISDGNYHIHQSSHHNENFAMKLMQTKLEYYPKATSL